MQLSNWVTLSVCMNLFNIEDCAASDQSLVTIENMIKLPYPSQTLSIYVSRNLYTHKRQNTKKRASQTLLDYG